MNDHQVLVQVECLKKTCKEVYVEYAQRVRDFEVVNKLYMHIEEAL